MSLKPETVTGRYDYIVVARSDGDTWSYGPFTNLREAEELEHRLADEYRDIEYETTELFNPPSKSELF